MKLSFLRFHPILFKYYWKSFEFCRVERNNLKSFTKSQLALRNGQDCTEIWCCFEGRIYELTPSKMWANGHHYEHWAGQDLTDELKDAPHNEQVFKKFKIVGLLVESK